LLLALGDTMDDVASETRAVFELGSDETWHLATGLIDKGVAPFFLDALVTAKSINWLADVVRGQGAAHGLPEGRHPEPGRQWLTLDELHTAVDRLVVRFMEAGPAVVFSKPSPLDILFLWGQLGDHDGVRAFVTQAIEADDMFLDAMAAMRGWSTSSEVGVEHPLRIGYVEYFTDAEKALSRLTAMSANPAFGQRDRAATLLRSWRQDG
jgi:hypothetical protein